MRNNWCKCCNRNIPDCELDRMETFVNYTSSNWVRKIKHSNCFCRIYRLQSIVGINTFPCGCFATKGADRITRIKNCCFYFRNGKIGVRSPQKRCNSCNMRRRHRSTAHVSVAAIHYCTINVCAWSPNID